MSLDHLQQYFGEETHVDQIISETELAINTLEPIFSSSKAEKCNTMSISFFVADTPDTPLKVHTDLALQRHLSDLSQANIVLIYCNLAINPRINKVDPTGRLNKMELFAGASTFLALDTILNGHPQLAEKTRISGLFDLDLSHWHSFYAGRQPRLETMRKVPGWEQFLIDPGIEDPGVYGDKFSSARIASYIEHLRRNERITSADITVVSANPNRFNENTFGTYGYRLDENRKSMSDKIGLSYFDISSSSAAVKAFISNTFCLEG